ncbi:MAG: DUF2799 domain-containing protein [Pseudomonadota bacterium]
MANWRWISGAAVLLALGGCAGLSEEECAIVNWEARGQADGRLGVGPTGYTRVTRSCSKYGIAPDYAAYERGRQQGLLRFCTPDGAYLAGIQGRGSTVECAGNDPSLTRIHRTAFDYHQAKRNLNRVRNEYRRAIDSRNNALLDIDRLRYNLRRENDQDRINDLRRNLRFARNRVARHAADEARLLFLIADYERALSSAQFQLDIMRNEFGLGYGPVRY